MPDTYHVLLLYPESIADYYGETYFSDQILADHDRQAILIAKHACAIGNEQPEGWADEFVTLLVMKGGEPC
jgi:hypothetical protein